MGEYEEEQLAEMHDAADAAQAEEDAAVEDDSND